MWAKASTRVLRQAQHDRPLFADITSNEKKHTLSHLFGIIALDSMAANPLYHLYAVFRAGADVAGYRKYH